MPRVLNIKNKDDSWASLDAIYVGRPSKYGNPFVIGKDGTREEVIEKYRNYAYKKYSHDLSFIKAVKSLRGKDLVCWCTPEPCHADILLEIANA